MASREQHGPSFPLWLRIQQEMDLKGISLRELSERSGVTHTVIRDLKTTSIRDRKARRDNALALGKVLGIGETEVLELAGILVAPMDPAVDVRSAITRSPYLDEGQKHALLATLDVFERDSPARGSWPVEDRPFNERTG